MEKSLPGHIHSHCLVYNDKIWVKVCRMTGKECYKNMFHNSSVSGPRRCDNDLRKLVGVGSTFSLLLYSVGDVTPVALLK